MCIDELEYLVTGVCRVRLFVVDLIGWIVLFVHTIQGLIQPWCDELTSPLKPLETAPASTRAEFVPQFS